MSASKLLLAGCLALGCAVVGVVFFQALPARKLPSPPVGSEGTPPPVQAAVPSPAQQFDAANAEAPAPPPPDVAPEELPAPKPAAARAKPEPAPTTAQAAPRPKQEILDPTARAALSFVGFDSEAEAYWYAAINDPGLPAHERKDLIEDLNEDGLSDPRRPAPGDLPLILSRLALIEEAAPFAMDKVNADAFQEAYKDLVNMVVRLTQR